MDSKRMTTTATSSRADATIAARLPREKLLDMLARMMLIRRFEERTAQSYQQARIGGFCHLYVGQEAVAVGALAALKPDDPIITAYRDHGHALARGMDPRYAMAEMFGKITGCAKGKGGSMHLFDKPNHMYGGHAIVGGQCPLGVGLAFACQYENTDKVAMCSLGDGALNQGAFHESMNLAAIWNLPLLMVLENNRYSMGTHINRGTSMADDLAAKAAGYGMRYAECDGMDVLEVFDCFAREIANARGAKNPQWERGVIPRYQREGNTPGPVFINVKTYRYKGHSMSDPQKYRSKEEVGEFEKQDCINRLVNHLIDQNHATQEEIEALDQQAKEAAKQAVKFALDSPDTPVEEMYTDVYTEPFGPFKTGEAPLLLRDAIEEEEHE